MCDDLVQRLIRISDNLQARVGPSGQWTDAVAATYKMALLRMQVGPIMVHLCNQCR
jgi:hypothetical protein